MRSLADVVRTTLWRLGLLAVVFSRPWCVCGVVVGGGGNSSSSSSQPAARDNNKQQTTTTSSAQDNNATCLLFSCVCLWLSVCLARRLFAVCLCCCFCSLGRGPPRKRQKWGDVSVLRDVPKSPPAAETGNRVAWQSVVLAAVVGLRSSCLIELAKRGLLCRSPAIKPMSTSAFAFSNFGEGSARGRALVLARGVAISRLLGGLEESKLQSNTLSQLKDVFDKLANHVVCHRFTSQPCSNKKRGLLKTPKSLLKMPESPVKKRRTLTTNSALFCPRIASSRRVWKEKDPLYPKRFDAPLEHFDLEQYPRLGYLLREVTRRS